MVRVCSEERYKRRGKSAATADSEGDVMRCVRG